MEESEKNFVCPVQRISHDEEKYVIEVELPGVSKEKIDLFVQKKGVCLNAPEIEETYCGCWTLPQEIDVERVSASYENGLLRVIAPIKGSLEGEKVDIE